MALYLCRVTQVARYLRSSVKNLLAFGRNMLLRVNFCNASPLEVLGFVTLFKSSYCYCLNIKDCMQNVML